MADDEDKPAEVTTDDIAPEESGPTPVDEETTNEPAEEKTEEQAEPKGPNVFQKFLKTYKARQKLAIPLTVLVVLVVLGAIPVTRYGVLGLVIKKDVSLNIVDTQTSVPVSGVNVTLRGQTGKTDGQGNVTLKGVKVGRAALKLTKKYYKDINATLTVSLSKPKTPGQFKIEATGRQVPVHVVNKITGQDVSGATIHAADTEAQTDKSGQATIVLPADQSTIDGTVSADKYNEQKVKITVNQQAVKDNTYSLTPAGKIYFLSKLSGKIDVVKTDLDGANRQTVIAGTGSEEEQGTLLLASRDWKYLALLAKRDNNPAKLYLIDTSNDKMTEIDSGDAYFNLVGWDDHYLVYTVTRNNIQYWQANKSALKSFNADSQQLATIDQTNAEGSSNSDYAAESIDGTYQIGHSIIYIKRWTAYYDTTYHLANKRSGIYQANSSGSNKQLVKDFAADGSYISSTLSKPDEIYYDVGDAKYEYKDGKISEAKDVKDEDFNTLYPTYLLSPGGTTTFWTEPRDGKNTLFLGDTSGDGGKQVLTLSEYSPYGWCTDDYLLVSKNGSELYILSVNGPGEKGQVLKITDYHKPAITLRGYGGGYGGI